MRLPRLILIVAMYLFLLLTVAFVSDSLVPYRSDFLYTTVSYFNSEIPSYINQTVAPFANFDGIHYLQISSEGYTDQGRFLPLYPGLLSVPTLLFGLSTFSSAQLILSLVLSWSVFIAMLITWKKVLSIDFEASHFSWLLLLVLAFPTSFFLVSIYSESLFLLLAGLSLLFAKQKKWYLSLIPAALLTITRLTGFVILPTLAFILWKQHTFDHPIPFVRKHFLKLLALALSITPLIIYAYFNYMKWGDWLYFVNAHGALGNSRETSSLVFPLVTVYRYLRILLTLDPALHEFRVALLELASLIGVSGLFIWSYLKKVPWEYLIFSGLAISIPILSGTLTGFPRYSLAVLPLLISLAELKKEWKLSLLSTSMILQILLFSLFVNGYYIA